MLPGRPLIVLDLNLPRRTGLEVLTIPVLILTTPAAPPYVQRSYSLHASAYIAKPADLDGFTDAIRQIARWFLELIELPPPVIAACRAFSPADRVSGPW